MKVACSTKGGEAIVQATAEVKHYSPADITSLVDKSADGDFEAFGELYNIYLYRIYRYVFYQVKDRMTAEDITEEVFVKAWKAIESCRGRETTFSAWIYRIAHNHIINTFRDNRKYAPVELDDIAEPGATGFEPETALEQQELQTLLADLPSNQRQVIILKFIEGLDTKKVGELLGKSEGAVRILQMRALTALRQKLGGGRYDNGQ